MASDQSTNDATSSKYLALNSAAMDLLRTMTIRTNDSTSSKGHAKEKQPAAMAPHSTNPTITYDASSSKYHVNFDGKTIVTTVTDKASIFNEWVDEVLLVHGSKPKVAVGIDLEWRPHAVKSPSNKPAVLQLCIDVKCIIFQLFYMDKIPESLKRLLLNPRFIFVGFEGDEDILKRKYGLDCAKSSDFRAEAISNWKLIRKKWPHKFRPRGLKEIAMQEVGLSIEKPKHVFLSNWESRVLRESQVKYACVDAYATFKIANKLLFLQF